MTAIRRRPLVALFLLAPGAALAQGHGRGQGRGNQGGGNQGGGGPPPGQGNQGGNHGNDSRGGPPGFSSNETVVIRNWQTTNPGWTPRPLPPGQMRQLARGRPLPPGLARQAVPPGLLTQLPVYPGHSYTMIGTSLVLLGSGGVVVDILANLF